MALLWGVGHILEQVSDVYLVRLVCRGHVNMLAIPLSSLEAQGRSLAQPPYLWMPFPSRERRSCGDGACGPQWSGWTSKAGSWRP